MHTLFTDPLWWHWMAFGLLLIAAEIVVPSFVVIWFGIAAVVVALIDLFFSTTFSTELFWWILFSVLFLYIWFKQYKPRTLTKSGQADENMGVKGVVTEEIVPFGRGRAKFEIPVLGSSEWVVTADEKITAGEEVVSVEALGNMLKVKKVH